ncbi:MAG: FtsX-like permease family protein [Spirochaetia bacterium]|nr:FtsX-like permease family protein [Spirochaetia bacterium]
MSDLFLLLQGKILAGNRRKRRHTVRSMLLIVLIVALLFLCQVFVTSMVDGIESTYVSLGGGNATTGAEVEVPDLPFVRSCDKVTTGTVLAYGKKGTNVCMMKGVDESTYFTKSRMQAISYHKETLSTSLPTVTISRSLGEKLGAGIGDSIALVAVGGEQMDKIRPWLCKVDGLYDSGYKELDMALVFSDRNFVEKIFPSENNASQEILFTEGYPTDKGVAQLQASGISCTPWYTQVPSLYQNLLTSEQTLLAVFIAIAILCGFFVSSLALELVQKDYRTIAVEKLLGLRNGKIRSVYFAVVSWVTVLAMATGVLLGFCLSRLMPYFLSYLASLHLTFLDWYLLKFEIQYPWKSLGIIFCILFAISVISVWFSLGRIRKVDPIELVERS